jgi:uncharacterized protein YndB with AHSA1/START domain
MEMSKTETSLELKRVFQAPLQRLYQAWIDPQMLNAWFHPNNQLTTEAEVDLQVGGRYRIQMKPAQGEPYIVGGVYQEIVPEEKLVFTWRWHNDETEAPSLVTVLFRAVSATETEVVLRHEQLGGVEDRDNHALGWQGTFEQLAGFLEPVAGSQ